MPPRASVSATPSKKAAAKPAAPAVDPIVQFLADHAADIEQLDNGKIRVKISGVDLPKKLDVLQKYFSGKAIKKSKKKAEFSKINLEEFPFIQQNKKLKNRYFCTLTKTNLNSDATEIQAHVNGKKYQHELKKHEAAVAAEEAAKAAKQAKKDAKRQLNEAVDDGVFDRLPEGVADEEGEIDEEDDEELDESMAQSEDEEDEEDDAVDNQLVREVAEEDDGMPIIRKRPATAADRKRAREEDNQEDVAELMNEDDDEDFEEVAGESDEEEDEEDDESEEEIVQPVKTAKKMQTHQPKPSQQPSKQQNGKQNGHQSTAQPKSNGPAAKKRK